MPRPIAVNTGAKKNKTVKRGNIEIASSPDITAGSESLTWYTSVPPGSGIVFVTDSYVQGYSTLGNARPIFYYCPSNSDIDIKNTINGLPDRVGQTPFGDAASALAWVASSNKLIHLVLQMLILFLHLMLWVQVNKLILILLKF